MKTIYQKNNLYIFHLNFYTFLLLANSTKITPKNINLQI